MIATLRTTRLRALLAALVTTLVLPTLASAQEVKPLRALYITGGCCHDYDKQRVIIPEGVSARAKVEWTIVQEGGTSQNHRISIYEKEDWAKGYDVVVHNECFGAVADKAFIERVANAHRDGTPGVMIHCTMHTFRALETDEWRECLGVTTRRHGPQQPLDVKNLKPEHPIMTGFPSEWKTGKEELYAIEKIWPDTTPLAQAYALDNKKDHAVIWTHTFGKGRVFGTTLAHNNATVSDPVYLDMLTRGLLWACDKLEDNGSPKAGYGVAAAK
jgi:type 1 glutamine amidotransferase